MRQPGSKKHRVLNPHNPFIGTWKLISWTNIDINGVKTYPCGRNPIGYLLYTEDGYMSAEVMDAERHQSDNSSTVEPISGEGANQHRSGEVLTHLSYCGTYSYSIEKEIIIHSVKASSIANWVGKENRRHFNFNNGTLRINTLNSHSSHTSNWVIFIH